MAAERDIDDLPRNDANYTALTPLWFLERAALTHPARASVVHGPVRYTWADTYRRCRRLASALARRSVGHGSTVAVIAPNIPAIYEAHFGVPMAGAVVNCVNIRLNAPTVAFLLEHSSAEVVMVDQEFFSLAEDSLRIIADKTKGAFKQPLLIVIGDQTCDPAALQNALRKGAIEYEAFLESGDPEFAWKPPQDEWKSIALGYTSGTTSNPKGVVLHHRGAYLMSLSAALIWGMNEGAVYLWTLPMFHCNGWCYTWTLAALCGTSICLRQVSAKAIFSTIANQGVTHFCGAPVVLNTIINAPPADTILPLPRVVNVMTAGAAPPPSVLASMSKLGFRITHTYGLSETYGPSTVCAWKPEWDSLPADERARLHARQGIRYVGLEGLEVVDPKTMAPVPADSTTMGEIVMRGNGVMKGYLNFDIRTRPHNFSSNSGTKDLQMVNLTLRLLSRPDVDHLPTIFTSLGLEYDDKVLPSIGNEVLKAVVAQFNADQLLTERPHVSALVRDALIRRAREFNIILDDVAITHLSYGIEFSQAVEKKQVAQQEAERSKFLVAKAEQERRAAVVRAEGESESARLISEATAMAGTGLIELRRIEAAKEIAAELARSPNVAYIPSGDSGRMLLGLNAAGFGR